MQSENNISIISFERKTEEYERLKYEIEMLRSEHENGGGIG